MKFRNFPWSCDTVSVKYSDQKSNSIKNKKWKNEYECVIRGLQIINVSYAIVTKQKKKIQIYHIFKNNKHNNTVGKKEKGGI